MMDIGRLLGSAGRIGGAWRQEEDLQRQSRQTQLQTENMDRLDRLRQLQLQAPPVTSDGFEPTAADALPVRTIEPPAPVPATAGMPAPTAPTAKTAFQPTIQSRTLPPAQPAMPQTQADRLALLRGPTAAADVFQAPAAAALNIGGRLLAGGLNLGGRVVNAFTGSPTVRTDYAAPQFSLTPFYDRYVRQPEQQALDAAQAAQRGQLPPTPQAQLPEPQRLLQAMIQVESAGRPSAVSNRGAVGLMQVMPKTAMDPGFGLPNIFDFAQQMGTAVGSRTQAEAKRLLADPAVGAAYGQRYMDAMLQRYNGNLEYALVAYNAGPGAADKWLAAGADYTKLPAETQAYIPKVLTALGAAAPAATTPAAIAAIPSGPVATGTIRRPTAAPAAGMTMPGISTAAAATMPAAAPAAVAPAAAPTAAAPAAAPARSASEFYLANPQSIPEDMRRAMQQRQEIERMADMYQRAGLGAQYMETRAKLLEMDNNMIYLQGMQGLQEFSIANDPRRLASVWSRYAGTPVGIQPRSDGKFDILFNGRRAKEGVSASEVADSARLSFDAAFRQQRSAASATYNMETFKSGLKVQEENARQLSQMIREVTVERAKGNGQLALEQLKQMRYDVKPSGAGDGTVIITPPGSSAPFIYNPTGRTITIDGISVTSQAAYPIAGLPSFGGMSVR